MSLVEGKSNVVQVKRWSPEWGFEQSVPLCQVLWGPAEGPAVQTPARAELAAPLQGQGEPARGRRQWGQRWYYTSAPRSVSVSLSVSVTLSVCLCHSLSLPLSLSVSL